MKKGIIYGVVAAVTTVAVLSLDAYVHGEHSVASIALTVTPEAEQMPVYEGDLEITYVTEQTEYRGGDVAFVDYGVDPQGECIAVWVEARSLFRHCDDIEAGWQTLYHREVPAGTDYWAISTYWSETFAPYNWSS